MKLEIAVCIFIKSSFSSSLFTIVEAASRWVSLDTKRVLPAKIHCVFIVSLKCEYHEREQKNVSTQRLHIVARYGHKRVRSDQECHIVCFFKILIHTWCFEQNTRLVIRVELIEDFNCVRDIEIPLSHAFYWIEETEKKDRSRFECQTLISLDRLCLKSSSSSIIFRNCWRELEPSIWQQARQADNKVERHTALMFMQEEGTGICALH